MILPTKIVIAVSVSVLLLSSVIVNAAEIAAEKVANPAIEQKALDLLENMSAYLADAKTMTFTASTMVETSVKGQLLNFFSHTKVTLKRPNGLKAITKSDSKPNEFYFDGKNMTSYSPKDKMYAVTATPATLDELFPFAMEKAGIHTAFSDILTSDPYAYITADLTSAFTAGQSTIGGVLCDHLALKGDGIEWQIWIAVGNKPLPVLMTMTYTTLPDKPRFILQYSDWKLNVPITKGAFAFKVPTGVMKISYQTAKAAVADDGGAKK